jgi:transposase
MFSTAPPPAFSMCGTASWVSRNGREDVDLVGPAEIVHRHVEGLGPAAAGVVHEDRQAAEIVDRRLHRRLKVLFLGDVAGEAHRLAAGLGDALGHLVRRLLLEVADHDGSARAREHLGDAAADAGARAGDERHLTVEAEFCWIEHVSRGEAAETGGVGRQILRDWVERFNAEGPAGLIGRKPPGNRPKLDDAQRAALVRVVESGPNPVRDGVVRWRLIDLAAWVWDKFGISVSAATLSRELNALGFGKLSARPRHYAQNAEEIAAFKKTSPSGWRKSARRFPRAPQ